jgi:drug/metabolite transporter (DMT)-like permease
MVQKTVEAAGPITTPAQKLTVLDALLFLTMLIWGTHFVVAKAALDILPPLVFNAFRFTIGACTLGVVLKFSGEKMILPRREWLPLILVAFLINAVYQPLFMGGLKQTTVGNSVLIITTAPLWLVLVNVVRKQERTGRGMVIGGVLALTGVVLVVLTRYAGQFSLDSTTISGDILTVIASFVWVVSVLASRDPLLRNSLLPTSFWISAWGAIFSDLISIPDMLRVDWSQVNPNVFLAILYSGFLAIGVAGPLWNRAVKLIGTSRTSVFINLQPIIAATVAALFLGEHFTPWLVLGTALVLSGMWLVRKG